MKKKEISVHNPQKINGKSEKQILKYTITIDKWLLKMLKIIMCENLLKLKLYESVMESESACLPVGDTGSPGNDIGYDLPPKVDNDNK